MDYNDELPATTLNAVGNAAMAFILSLLPSNIEYYTPVRSIYLIKNSVGDPAAFPPALGLL